MTATAASHRGLFGTCAAIGEDFGFNPEWLRAALVVALLVNAVWVIAIYLAMSAVVVASRRLVRARPRTATVVALPRRDVAAVDYAEAA